MNSQLNGLSVIAVSCAKQIRIYFRQVLAGLLTTETKKIECERT